MLFVVLVVLEVVVVFGVEVVFVCEVKDLSVKSKVL